MIHNVILASFREEFNFTIDWLPYSGSYGTYDPMNKSWNGMMKELDLLHQRVTLRICRMKMC